MILYAKKIKNKNQCLLCPRRCVLEENQYGFCGARKNINDSIVLESYGYSSGFAIDPIEKKPLYHFYPTSKALSFGTYGCNMGCLFCQNHNISKIKFKEAFAQKATPEQIVATALKYDCKSIAFTYNEPIIFYEYALDIAKIARNNGIKTVAVTAGYILPEPRKEFFSYMDAANIDLKAFNKEFYKKYCFADIDVILDTIKYVSNETDCKVELTTLIIDGENDNDEDFKNECEWILNNIGENIPLHLSAFHPDYKFLNRKQTPPDTIIRLCKIAKEEGLKFVYSGNIKDERFSITACPKCGYKLIERNGYQTRITGLNKNKCGNCGQIIYGGFE